jgi:1-acyl-sn-glycerol-3-phosphate acyltransferase
MAHGFGRVCRWILRRAGWTVDIVPPDRPKGVIAVYPHTSNWDFVVGYLAKAAGGLELQWIGKDALFRPPFGAIFRRLGGIPVRRGARSGLVAELVEEYARRERIWIAMAPEGTRGRIDHWKSGFYRLALAAEVPLGLASIDYARRRVELRTYVELTGDPEADLARFRERYEGVRGLRPEKMGEIRFRPAPR